MKSASNCRAWSIIKLKGETYIIVQYQHNTNTVYLHKWKWGAYHRVVAYRWTNDMIAKVLSEKDFIIVFTKRLDEAECLFNW